MERTLGLIAAGVVLAGGLAACSKSITGSAIAGAAGPVTTAPAGGNGGGGGGAPTTTPSGAPSGDLSQQAQDTCAQFPKDSVTSAFGVPDVTVKADSGTTLTGGIKQIKCVISSSNGFRANVVVQIYPSTLITTAAQYYQIMQQQFGTIQKLDGISGADVAGLFQDHQTGSAVDEAFAAKADSESNTVDVVLAGVADSPGIQPKLVTFLTALANS
ncbi:MAG TPA: hypothetical protein VH333_08320 [Pseudonocardiaceae bacterium]|jgi:hypothetical protein|nr:hypothetical protein [Pseudonocardiaceae bacterium]